MFASKFYTETLFCLRLNYAEAPVFVLSSEFSSSPANIYMGSNLGTPNTVRQKPAIKPVIMRLASSLRRNLPAMGITTERLAVLTSVARYSPGPKEEEETLF